MKIKRVFEQVQECVERDARQKSPGEFLPSEMQYARTLGVGRLTVRKAIDELVRIGLVRRLPGKGLMVAYEKEPVVKERLLFSLPCITNDAEFFQTLLGCIDAANTLDYDYKILSFTDVQARLEMIRKENLSQYKGAVISCFESSADKETLRLLREAGLRVMVMGNDAGEVPCIVSDDFNGGYMIGEYFIQHGHRDIVFLTSDRPVTAVIQRTEGFKQALADHNLPIRDNYILSVADPGVPLSLQNVEQRQLPKEAMPFLNRQLAFTALSGYSTLPILSMLNQLHRRGFLVPQDVSVIAYGNQPYFAAQDVPLTAVMSHNYDQGALAVKALHECIAGKRQRIESVMVPITFVKYKSVTTLP